MECELKKKTQGREIKNKQQTNEKNMRGKENFLSSKYTKKEGKKEREKRGGMEGKPKKGKRMYSIE